MKHLTTLLFAFSAVAVFAQQQVASFSAGGKYNFIENKGQITDQDYNPNPEVKYLFPGNGLKVHLRQQGWSYEVFKMEKKEPRISEATGLPEDDPFDKFREPEEVTIHTHRIDIQLIGSNPCAELVAEEPAQDYINYYTAGTPEEGVTKVHYYKRVVYKDIYHKIDIEFIVTDERSIKYNFIVHPGGDYRDIKLKYEGADGLGLCDGSAAGANNALAMTTALGELREEIPYSYQILEQLPGGVKPVEVSYRTLPGNLIGLKVNGKLTPGLPLIIDPVLIWGTYYGGSEGDAGISVTTDIFGNVYLVGSTSSTSDIVTSGVHQTTYGGGDTDAFLVQFNSNRVRQWATYYGGSNYDEGKSVTTDAQGNVYLAGQTVSTSGIAFGGHQNMHGGGAWDAFLVKINSSGMRQWSTYYCGSGVEYGNSVVTDTDGNVYLAGHTSSISGIASGGHQNIYEGGNSDAFLVKFNSSGARQWATYYGGSNDDLGISVATDSDGNVYLGGRTSSFSGVSFGGHQNTYGGGGNDAFLVKFNSSGVRQWATYYGGGDNDNGYSVATDAGGNVSLAGSTQSTSGIASGVHQTTYGGSVFDAFLVKFNSSGVRLWATYYGGSGVEYGNSVATDADGNIYLAGHTSSISGIASGGHQNIYEGGNSDAFLVKFNSSGVRQWATYYGGSGDDYGWSVAIGMAGNVYLVGGTSSTSGITSGGGNQNTYGGGTHDAFLAKFWGGNPMITNHFIKGNVYADINSNCIQDTNDIARQHILLKAEPGPYYGVSDTSGNYIIYLPDTGSYTVSVATQDTIWQLPCSSSYNVQLTTTPDTATGIDFAMSADYYCQHLTVDGGTPFMRRCFNNTLYFHYSNTGTLPASGVYIEVDFGPYLLPQSSTVPWSSVKDNIYTFPIGNLNIQQQGNFHVTALLTCDAELGSTQCVTARILPDFPCGNPDPVYDRRQVYLYGECIAGDSVRFYIHNQHDFNTHSGYFELYINSALADSIPYSLTPGDSMTLTFPANGNTLRLEINFVIGQHTFPGVQYTVEGCGPNPAWGNVNSLPQNDNELNIETFCLTVIGAYDPNDKQVFPEGLTANRYIKDDTELEYLIRFQNTGTDTAFTVIIRDTLSAYLDIPTIQLGSSSHEYVFNIYGQGIAEWTFNNILLPDSFVNEPESHGFVKYKIRQQSGNTPGTVIENRAGIYFDFNAPIITNTVFNTVHDTVLLHCQNIPVITASGSVTLCEGDSITLTSSEARGNVWSNGATTPSIVVSQSGIYTVHYEDFYNCVTAPSHAVTISLLPLPDVTFVLPAKDTIVCEQGGLITLAGGSPPGGTYTGTGISNGQFNPQAAGEGVHLLIYEYATPDGCANSDAAKINVSICPGIESVNFMESISVFPNPTRSGMMVQWEAAAKIQNIRLWDVYGRLLEEIQSPQGLQHEFNMTDCPKGVYLITFTGNGSRTVKVIKVE